MKEELNELYGRLEIEQDILEGLQKKEKDIQLKLKNYDFTIELSRKIIKELNEKIAELEKKIDSK